MEAICKYLGFHDGQYHLIHRSNAQYNIRWLFWTSRSGLYAYRFPDLDWVLNTDTPRQVVVFCQTIALTHRVFTYLWVKAAGLADRRECIRAFMSLTSASYNRKTIEFLRNTTDNGLRVTVGTDTMAFGLDARGTTDIVSFGHIPSDTNLMLQRAGCIRDGRLCDGHAIVYLPRKVAEIAAITLRTGATSHASRARKRTDNSNDANTKESHNIDLLMARVILAACKVNALNTIYDNPQTDAPCTCDTCATRPPASRPVPCNCSGCSPEPDTTISEGTGQAGAGETEATSEEGGAKVEADEEAQESGHAKALDTQSGTVAGVAPAKSKKGALKITKKMCEHGLARLKTFHYEVWDAVVDAYPHLLLDEMVLPDCLLDRLFDRLSDLGTDSSVLRALLDEDSDARYVHQYLDKLFKLLTTLHGEFKHMAEETRQVANEKRRATIKARKLASLAYQDKVLSQTELVVHSAGHIRIPGGKSNTWLSSAANKQSTLVGPSSNVSMTNSPSTMEMEASAR
ncbi:hypothetical protein C8Q72DRAFT_881462 [Fomitopsis betulina]|nr:hypothetical protein C8Q72DRAFT_881462 [Fomitopsis betulina]